MNPTSSKRGQAIFNRHLNRSLIPFVGLHFLLNQLPKRYDSPLNAPKKHLIKQLLFFYQLITISLILLVFILFL